MKLHNVICRKEATQKPSHYWIFFNNTFPYCNSHQFLTGINHQKSNKKNNVFFSSFFFALYIFQTPTVWNTVYIVLDMYSNKKERKEKPFLHSEQILYSTHRSSNKL